MGEKFDPNKHDALFQVGMFRTNVTYYYTNYVALVGKSAVFAIYPFNFIHKAKCKF